MKMEQTECSETSAYKIQTPENYPEENIQKLYSSFNLGGRWGWVVNTTLPPLYP
jgi:hypothetical protein